MASCTFHNTSILIGATQGGPGAYRNDRYQQARPFFLSSGQIPPAMMDHMIAVVSRGNEPLAGILLHEPNIIEFRGAESQPLQRPTTSRTQKILAPST